MNVVYLIQAGDAGPVLLGMTDNRHLQRKITRLQDANAELLHVRHILDGDERLERRLRDLWGDHNIRGGWHAASVLDALPDDTIDADINDDLDERRRIAALELAQLDNLPRRAP